MSESDHSIDYEGFKGAGGPRAPPPQKPNTNPTKGRIYSLNMSLIGTIIIFFVCFTTFKASGTLLAHIISALCAGLAIAIWDFNIESYAYVKGLWFCYGGYQKIGRLDFKHVPIEMVLGFIAIGFSFAFVSYWPELFRSWGWNFWPISNPNLDIWSLPGFIVIMGMLGAYGDFLTKRSGIWMNGPTWSYWKCAFFAWVPGLSLGIIVDRLIFYLWSNPIGLTLAILIPFLILIIVAMYLIRKVL